MLLHLHARFAVCIFFTYFSLLLPIFVTTLSCIGVYLCPGHEVDIKLEYILKLKIKRNNWLLADMCPQPENSHSHTVDHPTAP